MHIHKVFRRDTSFNRRTSGSYKTRPLSIGMLIGLLVFTTSCGSDGTPGYDSPPDMAEMTRMNFVPVLNSRSWFEGRAGDGPIVETASTQEKLEALWAKHLDSDTAPRLTNGNTFLFVWAPRDLLEVRNISSGASAVVVSVSFVTVSGDSKCAEVPIGATTPWVAIVKVNGVLPDGVRLDQHPADRSC